MNLYMKIQINSKNVLTEWNKERGKFWGCEKALWTRKGTGKGKGKHVFGREQNQR